jgi:NhaP-type Na+/H+ or K+/H+ antiporter
MLELKEGGFGRKKEVPTIVLAGASVDDVFAITIFGVFAGLAAGGPVDLGYLLLGAPAGIVLGGLIGAGIGFALVWLFKRYHLRDAKKVILERYDVLANRLALKFQKIWVLAEVLLFVYIGAEVRIGELTGPLVGTGLAILAIGLAARSLGVVVSLHPSPPRVPLRVRRLVP